jgi:hypothetical protein
LRQTQTNFQVDQFVDFYYKQFDADRKQLAPLYVSPLYLEVIQILTIHQRENSMLTFESASIAGAGGIVEKLSVSNPNLHNTPLANEGSLHQSLPFEKVKHAVSTLDAQPSENGGILILVTGALLVRHNIELFPQKNY